MVDEAAFHASREQLNPNPCVFAKAILAGCASCSLARHQALAEREVVACSQKVAHINCSTLKDLLYERATFALRLPRPASEIPHLKAMKLVCGGLQGLQAALAAPKPDVHAMVQSAQSRHDSLLDLPWQAIVVHIAAWQMRRRAPADQ
ncbi:hypothetical protein [Rhodoferax sp.]|uniref:hypothetical protein n=1 Tax=Rhodoferax sp. TaxID=50421 RepID=UPI0019F2CB7F|nr:hypothetical protein [Rhodoferax sp.]MBE0472622.1 hypothetical protein [Rhodoferax sp.]